MAKEQDNRVILAPGVSFARWKADLQDALSRRNCVGHIFHNMHGIPPAVMPQPIPPRDETQTEETYNHLLTQHNQALYQWSQGEIQSKNILISRLSDSLQPESFDNFTAKQLYDLTATTREQWASAPYQSA
ncbi:hypothetical protein OnM2_076065, partial [Erysiphe neolycopersici]